MLIKKAPDIRSAEITPQSLYLRRREFIQGAAGISAAATLGGALGGEEPAYAAGGEKLAIARKSPFSTDEKLTPLKDVTTYNNFYEFGLDKDDPSRYAGSFKPQPWSVAIAGLCHKPGVYTLEDMLRPHPLEERIYRMRCVEGWSMVIPWATS